VAGAGEDNMGGAAALIPGIVGIAGGEYAGYKKRQGEEEMLRNRIASAGRFLGEEQQPQRNSMGVPAPNIEQRDPLAPGIGGESTRRALDERSYSGMARNFAIEQAINGNLGPLNDMTKARMTPEKIVQDYGNSPQEGINPATGEIEQYLIEKNSGRQLWLGTKPVPKVEKASDYITRFNDWKLSNPKGTMMQFDAANAERTGEKDLTVPSFEYTNNGKTQQSYNMKIPAEVAAYENAIRTPGIFKGTITAPSVSEKDKTEGKIELERAVDDFATLFVKYGTETGVPYLGNPRVAGEMGTARGAILAAVKKAETLGTLDRGLIEFFKLVLDDPTGLQALMIPDEKIKGQLEGMYKKLGKEPPPGIKASVSTTATPLVGGAIPRSRFKSVQVN